MSISTCICVDVSLCPWAYPCVDTWLYRACAGMLYACCSKCNRAYHLNCLNPPATHISATVPWICPQHIDIKVEFFSYTLFCCWFVVGLVGLVSHLSPLNYYSRQSSLDYDCRLCSLNHEIIFRRYQTKIKSSIYLAVINLDFCVCMIIFTDFVFLLVPKSSLEWYFVICSPLWLVDCWFLNQSYKSKYWSSFAVEQPMCCSFQDKHINRWRRMWYLHFKLCYANYKKRK